MTRQRMRFDDMQNDLTWRVNYAPLDETRLESNITELNRQTEEVFCPLVIRLFNPPSFRENKGLVTVMLGLLPCHMLTCTRLVCGYWLH